MRVALTHELSQPLSALATYIHAGRRAFKVDELDRELLAETIKGGRSNAPATSLRGCADSSSATKPEPLPVNLLDLIRTVADRLANEASTRAVRIDVEPATVPIVMVDPFEWSRLSSIS